MNLFIRLPVESARATVQIPSSDIEYYGVLDNTAWGYWDFYNERFVSQVGGKTLTNMDAGNTFNNHQLQVSAQLNKAVRSPMQDNIGDLTMMCVVNLLPNSRFNATDGLVGVIMGNFTSIGFVQTENGLNFKANAIAASTKIADITAEGYAFISMSLKVSTKTLHVRVVQPASGIDYTRDIVGTNAFTPAGGPLALGNYGYTTYQSNVVFKFPEFGLYNRTLSAAELEAAHQAAKVRCNDKGIYI
ncbi:hypothetical protein EDF75_0793 [Raoultella sp. BIGb0149]|uniref:hypothetical protein n=1 Tax=Raoultella sp. BIGb0149 TaxID=2485116 RepID=UPI0010610C2D|nr:hypothetical protein [Raoultella sp. BIGb0149]TDQ26742.1 hypothetical protein EDF75_0793 [Raoultella sp. BIGb0149]